MVLLSCSICVLLINAVTFHLACTFSRFARASFLCACGVIASVAPVHAHDGEDHGNADKSTTTSATTQSAVAPEPRVVASSEELELVGILSGKAMAVYIDRRATNEPVSGLAVAMETGDKTYHATPRQDAVYMILTDQLDTPGRHDLVFTIQGPGVSDLLAGTIEIPPRQGGLGSILLGPMRRWGWLIVGAALILFWVVRRYRHRVRGA